MLVEGLVKTSLCSKAVCYGIRLHHGKHIVRQKVKGVVRKQGRIHDNLSRGWVARVDDEVGQ